MERRKIFKYLEARCADSWHHSGKYLWSRSSKKYAFCVRDRQPDQSYFEVHIKGSRIVLYQIKYMLNGKGVNTYISCFIPAVLGGMPELPEQVKRKLIDIPPSRFRDFPDLFREATPTLNWSM